MIRTALFAAVASLAWTTAQAQSTSIAVAKSPTCGCCNAWIEHLEANGFEVEATNMTQPGLNRFKRNNGIGPETMSCHTARVEGYTIEGHVPASDIRKLLDQRPDAIGLSVPGMPVGSPGMEMGEGRDAYSVLLIGPDGKTQVFSAYEAK